ncbi:MAG: hypothetical protein NT150_14910 [Bacteroidetes bacterium]|nr:hypothetical protein [Bacteroidota bacterium]
MKIKELCIIIFLVATCFINAIAQKYIYIGANINCELLGDYNPRFGSGITFEKKFREHHGLEAGLFYRGILEDATATIFDTTIKTYDAVVIHRYISFPLYYKHYWNKLNFSIGFNFDYLVGDKIYTEIPDSKPFFYPSAYAEWRSGVSLKLSRSYYLKNNFMLEPEIRSSMLADGDGGTFYFGLGITGKFDLSSIMKSEITD